MRTNLAACARQCTTPAVLIGGLLLVLLVTELSGSVGLRNAGTTLLIHVVVVVGLYLFVGSTGILSFGHAAFMALGAYAAALLTLPAATKLGLTLLPSHIRANEFTLGTAILAAGAVAAAVGLAVGLVLMRLHGLNAGIATLALLIIVNVVISQSTRLTRGPSALVGVPVSTTPVIAFAGAAGAVLVAWLFQRSTMGLRLRASRDDYLASRASGVRVYRLRVVAFVISAAVVGVGGGLYALRISVLSPSSVYLSVTFIMIAMLVVGGMRSLTGAVLGTVVVSALEEALRHFESGITVGPVQIGALPGLAELGTAVLLLIVLLFRPTGLTRGQEAGDFIASTIARAARVRPATGVTS